MPAVPIDKFDPVREATKNAIAKKIRAILVSGRVDPDDIAGDPLALLADLESNRYSVSDPDLLGQLQENLAQLRNFTRKPDAEKFLKTTKEVRGTDFIDLGVDEDGLERRLAAFESELTGYAKKMGINLGDEFSDSFELGRIKDPDKYRYFKGKYAEIIGLRDVLEEQGTGVPVVTVGEAAERRGVRPYHRFAIDPASPKESLRRSIYSRLNLQITPEVLDLPERQAYEAYGVSGNIPKLSTVMRDRDALVSGRVPVGRKAILDIETAGLEHSSGMWNLAVRYSDEPDRVENLFFRNPNLDKGIAFVEGRTVPLSEGIMGPNARYASMSDLKRVIGSLVDDETYIVGHNAASFDLPFIMSDLKRLATELAPDGVEDQELLELRDALGAKIKRGKVLDTMSIMGQKVDELGIGLDKRLLELPNGQVGKVKSIQNLLLQTNILDLMSTDPRIGDTGILDALAGEGKGTHMADVDTMITGALADQDILDNLESRTSDTLTIGSLKRPDIDKIINEIVRSGASTPFTSMDPGGAHSGLKELLRRNDYDPKTKPITPFEMNILEQRYLARDLPNIDPDGTDPMRYFNRAGEFDDFINGLTGPATPEQVHELQQTLAGLNLPHANLSDKERTVSAALARVSTPLTSDVELTRHLDGILPTSTWFTDDKIQVFEKSGRISIPKNVLAAAEAEGVFSHGVDDAMVQRTGIASGEELYALSPFKYKQGTKKNVAKTFMLSSDAGEAKAEAAALYDFLVKNQTKFEIPQRVLDNLSPLLTGGKGFDAANPAGVFKYGIQTGLLRSMGSPDDQASQAFDEIVRFMGGDPEMTARPADLSGPTAYVGDIGTDSVRSGRRVQRSGPAVLGNWMDRRERRAYAEQNRYTDEIFGTLKRAAEDKPSLLRNGRIVRETGQQIFAEKYYQFWGKHLEPRKGLLATGVAAGLAAGGYYMHKRHQKKEEYFTDVMEQMPTEDENWYGNYQREMSAPASSSHFGASGYARPKSTVNVVRDLDNNKIRHTQMGAQKYAHLYGG